MPGIHRVCTLLAALACLTLLPSTLATHDGMKAVINGTERDHPPEYGEDMNPKNNLAMCNPPNNADGACCAMGHGGGWGWLPAFHNEYLWSPGLRGFLYGVGLIWAFFGVAILSDAFMAGIETITGTTKIVKSKGPNGEDIETEELVWNPAVANLSLLALGSSAPEIMMSCIEIAANQGKFGAIGAPTVVGSASFNLFVIVGLCMLAIPEGENRKIDGVPGFICTSIASVFSYSWVCIIVLVITPNVVTFAEALITFLYMPLLVVLVYVIDAGLIPGLNNTASVAPEEGETPGGGVPVKAKWHVRRVGKVPRVSCLLALWRNLLLWSTMRRWQPIATQQRAASWAAVRVSTTRRARSSSKMMKHWPSLAACRCL